MKSQDLYSIYQLDTSTVSNFIYDELDDKALGKIEKIIRERVTGSERYRSSEELFSRVNIVERTKALSIFVERKLEPYKDEIVERVCVENAYCDFISDLKEKFTDSGKLLLNIYEVLCDLAIGFPANLLAHLTILLVHTGILKSWCECE